MKQVDKHFSEKLKNHESEVPADMWDRIAPALEKESKRPLPFMWFLVSAGVLLFSGGAFWWTAQNSLDTLDNQILMDNAGATNLVSSGSENENEVEYVANPATVSNFKNILNKNNAESALDSDSQRNTELAANTNENPITEQTITNSKNGTAINPSQIATITSDTYGTGRSYDGISSDIELGGGDMKLKITKSFFNGSDQVSDENTMTFSPKKREIIQSVDYLGAPNIQTSVELIDLPTPSIFGTKTPQCPSFLSKKRIGFQVDAFLSHDYNIKSYKGLESYAALKSGTESSLYSYGAGLRFSYYLGNGFGLKSGLHYSQVNEKFSFDDPNASEPDIITHIDITIKNGDTIFVERQETIEVPGRHTITHTNKYHFVEIPLLGFYEFSIGDSPFYYTINAGGTFNLLFKNSGKYINEDNEPVIFEGTDENPSPFNSDVGFSIYTSIGIHYILNDRMDLTLEPHFSTQLGSINRSSFALQERFTRLGVNTGVRYKF